MYAVSSFASGVMTVVKGQPSLHKQSGMTSRQAPAWQGCPHSNWQARI